MEVLDLRHFGARQLRELLEEEACVWERRLAWNYNPTVELLLEYLDSRMLPGYVVVENGALLGYTFCVYEGVKAVVGDAYAAGRNVASAAALPRTRTLLQHLVELTQNSPQVERVESQLLLYDAGELTELFEERGFRIYPRLFMEGEVAEVERDGAEFPPKGLTLGRWSPEYYQGAGELIHGAYAGHLDGEINDQYRTLHGSLRFLHNIVRFPGCGVFDTEGSWVLRDAAGAVKAMVLCSKVRSDMGHVTQLCVAPELRGRGIARGLMRHCAAGLKARGFGGLTLTVTEANAAAVRLYEDLGFGVRQRFEAMVWQKA